MRLNNLYKISTLSFFALFLSAEIILAQGTSAFQGEVNSNNINIRSDSTSNAQGICTVSKGERIEVILELYDWYKIRLPKNAPSYIKKSLAECFNLAQDSKTCLSAKISKDRVNIRLKPSESSAILGKLNKDEVVNIIEDDKGWYKIEPTASSFGWIHKKFVNKVSSQEKSIQKNPEDANLLKPKEGTRNKNIAIEGIIKPYGKIIKRIATHKLITADNKIYLLRGNKESLDALNYHKVKIMGKIIDAPKEKYPVIEIRILAATN